MKSNTTRQRTRTATIFISYLLSLSFFSLAVRVGCTRVASEGSTVPATAGVGFMLGVMATSSALISWSMGMRSDMLFSVDLGGLDDDLRGG